MKRRRLSCKHCGRPADGRAFCTPAHYLAHINPKPRQRSIAGSVGGYLQYDDDKWLRLAKEAHNVPRKVPTSG